MLCRTEECASLDNDIVCIGACRFGYLIGSICGKATQDCVILNDSARKIAVPRVVVDKIDTAQKGVLKRYISDTNVGNPSQRINSRFRPVSDYSRR